MSINNISGIRKCSSPAGGSRPNSRQQQHRHQQQQKQQQHLLLASPRSERIGRKMYSGNGNNNKANQWLDLPEDTMTRFHPGGGDPALSSPPHRSQSFRHRSRPNLLLVAGGTGGGGTASSGTGRRTAGGTANAVGQQNELGDSTPERRRSTPTIHRRASMGRSARAAMMMEPRIDVWPERKPMSEAEERFLQLPDQADYTRVRQFNIDAKGAVVSRGDSFRRKRPPPAPIPPPASATTVGQQYGGGGTTTTAVTAAAAPVVDPLISGQQQQPAEEEIQPLERSSTGSSMKSSISLAFTGAGQTPPSIGAVMLGTGNDEESQQQLQTTSPALPLLNVATDTPSCSYKICVLGQPGAGKSSLIRQFISSSTAFSDADDLLVEHPQQTPIGGVGATNCCVSVNIGGHECDLQFAELDLPLPADQDLLLAQQIRNFHAFLLVYSIDRKQSFRLALRTLEFFRSHNCPAPVILVGNKADLERRRTVLEPEVRSAMQTFDVAHFEVSVALDHDVDDLLVGIVAQVKEAFRMSIVLPAGADINQKQLNNSMRSASRASTSNSEDFHAAIRRFSQRKKRQMGVVEMSLETTKCMNLFEKLRKWRKGTSNC